VNLLAIDSASSILSIAVTRNDEIFYSETQAAVKHSEIVISGIDSLVKKVSLLPGDLDCVLCMKGPGSFTGLRIGFSIAKGLALSLSIPFVPVPTLDCIAFPYRNSGVTITVIESGKNAYFFSVYRGGKNLEAAQEAAHPAVQEAGISQITEKIENLKNEKLILTGPGSDLLYEKLPSQLKENVLLSCEKRGYARELILIAKNDNLLNNINDSALLFSGPEYFKKTDAELNLL
jgi:tRNA threonylcarbamoyladenosine biosynthesis protein TsaB